MKTFEILFCLAYLKGRREGLLRAEHLLEACEAEGKPDIPHSVHSYPASSPPIPAQSGCVKHHHFRQFHSELD